MVKEYLKNLFDKIILVEIDMHNLYEQLARFTKSAALKELFMTLADEEAKHKELFEQMDLSKILIANDEVIRKINVQGIPKTHLSERELRDIKVAIDNAIRFEQESYDTYEKMIEYMDESEEKFALEEIAKQELRHKEQLILAKGEFA